MGYTPTNAVGSSTGTVSITVTAATVTGLTTTVPTVTGSGSTGTASAPTLPPGGTLTSGLSYTSSNANVATVDPTTGLVTALTAGTTTITVTGPNGSRTTLTITVTSGGSGGVQPQAAGTTRP